MTNCGRIRGVRPNLYLALGTLQQSMEIECTGGSTMDQNSQQVKKTMLNTMKKIWMDIKRFCSSNCFPLCAIVIFIAVDTLFCQPATSYLIVSAIGNATSSSPEGKLSTFTTIYIIIAVVCAAVSIFITVWEYSIQCVLTIILRMVAVFLLQNLTTYWDTDDYFMWTTVWLGTTTSIAHMLFMAVMSIKQDRHYRIKACDIHIYLTTWVPALLVALISNGVVAYLNHQDDYSLCYFGLYIFGMEILILVSYLTSDIFGQKVEKTEKKDKEIFV